MRPQIQLTRLQQNKATKARLDQQKYTRTLHLEHGNQQTRKIPEHPTLEIIDSQQKFRSDSQKRKVLLENDINFLCLTTSAVEKETLAYLPTLDATDNKKSNQQCFMPKTFEKQIEKNLDVNNGSNQIADLNSSPPEIVAFKKPQHSKILNHISSTSNSTYTGEKQHFYSHRNSFDSIAKNFIINFSTEFSFNDQDNSIIHLPLSETEPLIGHDKKAIVGSEHSLRLSKNNASLIFTKKELAAVTPFQTPSTASEGSNYIQKKRQQRKTTYNCSSKRRSLQLNYNKKLVTTSTSNFKNNNRCPFNTKAKEELLLNSFELAAYTGLSTTAASSRKQHAYSWYAPVYNALEEELEHDSRDSSPTNNLANTKRQNSYQIRYGKNSSATVPDYETVALLETRNQTKIQAQLPTSEYQNSRTKIPNTAPQKRNSLPIQNSQNLTNNNITGGGGWNNTDLNGGETLNNYESQGPQIGLLGHAGGPRTRKRPFDVFKSWFGLMPSIGRNNSSTNDGSIGIDTTKTQTPKLSSPEIIITRTPSDQQMDILCDPSGRCSQQSENIKSNERLAVLNHSNSTSSLNVVQQKLWNIMRRDGSASSLHHEKIPPVIKKGEMRKCETVLELTRQSNSLCLPELSNNPNFRNSGSGIFNSNGVEQIRPLNRLRNSSTSMNITCSQCSSFLSIAPSDSRYSLNSATNGKGGSVLNMSTTTTLQQQNNSNTLDIIRTSFTSSADAAFRNVTKINDSNVTSYNISDLGTCSRKSSTDANSSHTTSSISTPSNQTTATTPLTNTTPTTLIPTVTVASNSSDNVSSNILATFPYALPGTQRRTSSFSKLRSVDKERVSQDIGDSASLHVPLQNQENNAIKIKNFEIFTCKLCLIDVENSNDATRLKECGCQFCVECMKAYVEFEISEGAYEISCPDAQCPTQGVITLTEIANLTTANLMKKHHRYRLNREIELDKSRTWCPRAGCETVCIVGSENDQLPCTSSTSKNISHPSNDFGAQLICVVQCPSCKDEFCSACKKTWHPSISCEENSHRLLADGQDDIGIPFDNDTIKFCPMCAVPIEKDEGCAQMMCKRCKHVFCWYCLASLDDDFLLRHYDKGPCKNKLGHSRASVVWHRAQVIGIFAGFGILLLVASPLLLLAAPCIICCKCRSCSGSKIDEDDGDMDEATALQR